jgi:hypothetical protein
MSTDKSIELPDIFDPPDSIKRIFPYALSHTTPHTEYKIRRGVYDSDGIFVENIKSGRFIPELNHDVRKHCVQLKEFINGTNNSFNKFESRDIDVVFVPFGFDTLVRQLEDLKKGRRVSSIMSFDESHRTLYGRKREYREKFNPYLKKINRVIDVYSTLTRKTGTYRKIIQNQYERVHETDEAKTYALLGKRQADLRKVIHSNPESADKLRLHSLLRDNNTCNEPMIWHTSDVPLCDGYIDGSCCADCMTTICDEIEVIMPLIRSIMPEFFAKQLLITEKHSQLKESEDKESILKEIRTMKLELIGLRSSIIGSMKDLRPFKNCTKIFSCAPFYPMDVSPYEFGHIAWSAALNKSYIYCALHKNIRFPVIYFANSENLSTRYSVLPDEAIYLGALFVPYIVTKLPGEVPFGTTRRIGSTNKFVLFLFYLPSRNIVRIYDFRGNAVDTGQFHEKITVTYVELNQLYYQSQKEEYNVYRLKSYPTKLYLFSKYGKETFGRDLQDELIPINMKKDESTRLFMFQEYMDPTLIKPQSGGIYEKILKYGIINKLTPRSKYTFTLKYNEPNSHFDEDIYPYKSLLKIKKIYDKKISNKKFYEIRNLVKTYSALIPYHIRRDARVDQTISSYTTDKRGILTRYFKGNKIPQSILNYEFFSPVSVWNLEILTTFFDELNFEDINVAVFSRNLGFAEAVSYIIENRKYHKEPKHPNIHPYILKYYFQKYDPEIAKGILLGYNLIPNYIEQQLTSKNIKKIITGKQHQYDFINIDPHFYLPDWKFMREHLNQQLFVSLSIIMFEMLKRNGNAMIIIPSISSKLTSQLVFLITSHFDKTYLYEPEIHTPHYGTICLLCMNYKPINSKELDNLYNLNDVFYKIDPTGGFNFNVYDSSLRKEMNINVPVSKKPSKMVSSFIQFDDSEFEKQLLDFNTKKIKRWYEFIGTMDYYEKNIYGNKKLTELMTERQLYDSISYAQRLNLDLKPTLMKKEFYDEFGQSLLQNMFSKDNAIQFKFKQYYSKDVIQSKARLQTGDISKTKLYELGLKFRSAQRILDTRSIDEYGRVTKLIEYYEKTLRHLAHAKYNAKYATRDWIIMYEILTSSEVIDKSLIELKTLSICELPGAFLLAMNHYIKTHTSIKDFIWIAQNSKNDKELDSFGLMRKYKKNWDYANNTGNMDMKNIKYYGSKYGDVDIITGNCGATWGEKSLIKSHFEQSVFILNNVPISKHFILKTNLPCIEPIKVCIYYLLWLCFDELMFYKPLQNSWSSMYYIIGKNRTKKLDENTMNMLFKILDKYDSNKTLFDTYPDEFLLQLNKAIGTLTHKVEESIKRNIYYLDNLDKIKSEHFEQIKQIIKNKNQDWVNIFKLKRINHEDRLV